MHRLWCASGAIVALAACVVGAGAAPAFASATPCGAHGVLAVNGSSLTCTYTTAYACQQPPGSRTKAVSAHGAESCNKIESAARICPVRARRSGRVRRSSARPSGGHTIRVFPNRSGADEHWRYLDLDGRDHFGRTTDTLSAAPTRAQQQRSPATVKAMRDPAKSVVRPSRGHLRDGTHDGVCSVGAVAVSDRLPATTRGRRVPAMRFED